MFRLKEYIKDIPAFPRMPLFCGQGWRIGLWSLFFILMGACHTDTRFHEYRSVSEGDGWDKSDTLVFDLPSEVVGGTYQMEIGIRHTGSYPYRDIWLSVTQGEGAPLFSHTDTLHIFLADENGRWNQHEGAIGGLYQLVYRCDSPVVLAADSLARSFRVTHLMRQNPLPGVSDVGVRLFLTSRVDTEKNEQQDGKSPQ